MKKNSEEILSLIDDLWMNFKNCRAHFPAISDTMIGEKLIPTAPYYIADGFQVSFVLNEPLDQSKINKMHEIGHWINQNFMVRLCALLESRKIIPKDGTNKIDQSIDGWEDIDLVRRLRNYFAHSSGKYNPSKSEHIKTMKVLGEHLNINIDGRDDFPLMIDTVLEPLFKGCRKYAETITA